MNKLSFRKGLVLLTTALFLVGGFFISTGTTSAFSVAYVTTDAATLKTSTTATLNGTVYTSNADNTSFWWGITPAGPITFGTDPGNSSEFPAGWIHDNGLGSALVGGSFSAPLTGLTPSTQYHFVAWSLVGGTWYPGAEQGFTTLAPEPIPAAHLVLTTDPTSQTITQSTLVAETNGKANDNSAVDTAIVGLTPIAVRLQNTGDAASANVRISPINADSHLQLWAKDTSNNWYDINVAGWIDTAGIAVPAGYSAITNVYAISDTTGDYPLTVNLVQVSDSSIVAHATGTVTIDPIIYTNADFAAFDGVDSTLHANGYTVSSHITTTYTSGTGTESDPVKLSLTGYAPIVTPWFGPDWTTYNYVTVGIKLPTDFAGTPSVYQTGIMRYDVNPAGAYKMSTIGDGTTPLATAGAASGYLDYSFAANSTNTKKEGLVKLMVIWNATSTPEYFTIDINGLQLAPNVPTATLTANGGNVPTNGSTNSETFTFTLSSADATHYQLKYWNDIVGSSYKESTPWSSTTLGAVYSDSFTQGEGTHYFAFSACNVASNCSDYSTPFAVTYDKTAPPVPQGSLIVKKVVINTGGGTAVAGDFSFKLNNVDLNQFLQNGDNASLAENDLSVDSGNYTITEVSDNGAYTISYNNCNEVNVVSNSNFADAPICTITNTFIPPTQYTLTYTAGDNGSITGFSPQTVDSNASGTEVTATPAVGYHFVSWSDNISTVATRTDTNVTANITTTANFAADTITSPARYSSSGYLRPLGQVLGASTGPIEGCDNRTTGFSITTGQSCVGNTGNGQVLGASSFHFTLFLKQTTPPPYPTTPAAYVNEIVELQKFLNAGGYNSGPVDGKFGPITKGAVIKFQLANGLKGDGVVGALTRAVLNK